jgi:hypothetical protein
VSRFSLAAVTLTLTLAAVLASPAVAQGPTLDYACSPEPADCLGWYRSAVNLSWEWNNLEASPSAGACNDTAFAVDTIGTETFCEIKDKTTQVKTRITLMIHVDRTPPTVRQAVPERPPDHAGWFNHPVTFSFQGGDATSGLQSCTSVAYSGPNGVAVQVPGSCRDVAGNVGVASFPLNYDATPPSAPDPLAIPGDRLMRIEWSGIRADLPGQKSPVRRARTQERGVSSLPRDRHRQRRQPCRARRPRHADLVAASDACPGKPAEAATAAHLEEHEAGQLLQRPALQGRPEGAHALATSEPHSTASQVALRRAQAAAPPGALRLVCVARLRQARGA